MNFDDIDFPLVLPGNRWKRLAFVMGGRLLGLLLPARRRDVAEGRLPARLGLLERLLIAAFFDKQMRGGTVDQLTPVHHWLWKGPQAEAFHQKAAERSDAWWQFYQDQLLEPIRTAIRRRELHTLCETGCGSATVIGKWGALFPEFKTLIGLDLSEGQTERNRKRYAGDARFRFEAGDACEWIPEHGKPGCLFLTNGGVLEYFSENRLRPLLVRMATEFAPSAITLIEPIAGDFDFNVESASRIHGHEHTFSHNYPLLCREAGFEILLQREQVVDGYRLMLLVGISGGKP